MKFKLLQEFKDFAVKGNMIDIAIGVIIGTAFNKVVNILVKEVLMPPLTLLTDGANWENKKIILREAILADGKPKIEEIAIGYGKLIEAGVDFLIIALTVFLVVKVNIENPATSNIFICDLLARCFPFWTAWKYCIISPFWNGIISI